MPARIDEILSFWFDDSRNDPAAAQQMVARWFSADPALDDEIRRRFASFYRAAVAAELTEWEQTARGSLALIIVLDQFSRNMFRGQPQAFAEDAVAQRLCLDGIEQQLDALLGPAEQGFFYMPLQHAENAYLQDVSVRQYEQLLQQSDAAWRPLLQGMLDYAREHRDIIHRFGRFPHRNAILGRPSTPAELAFLAQGGPDYGQKVVE